MATNGGSRKKVSTFTLENVGQISKACVRLGDLSYECLCLAACCQLRLARSLSISLSKGSCATPQRCLGMMSAVAAS